MSNSLIELYLKTHAPATIAPGFLAYLANLECVRQVAPEAARAIVAELVDQRSNIKMIASENFSSLATQCAMANLLTDKYAEGIPHHRFYAGCDNVDSIEDLANLRARELFGAAHAYAQPHSGADANLVAFWAVLRARVELPALVKAAGVEDAEKLAPADWYKLTLDQWREIRQSLGNQRLLGMDLSSGGHLTHGYRLNVSGKMFEAHGYTVDRSSYLLDYDQIERQALEVKPLILLAGFSAYPRNINYARMRSIADRAGALLMVDMAHFAGLVAGKVLTGDFDPIPHAQIVTTTTHKTLRGPRGGLVLCNQDLKDHVDRGCPLVLGGPLPHVMAAKTVAFTEALRPDFRTLRTKNRRKREGARRSLCAARAARSDRRNRESLARPRRGVDPRDYRPPGRRRREEMRHHAQPQPDSLRLQRPVVHQRPALRRRRRHYARYGHSRDERDRLAGRAGSQTRQTGIYPIGGGRQDQVHAR